MKKHLTEITIKQLKAPSKGYLQIFDMGYPGLAVRVGHGGVKSFEHFHRAGGSKLRREGLGRWPTVSLAEARDKWRLTRSSIAKGEVISLPSRNDNKGELFEFVVEEWLRLDRGKRKDTSQRQLERIVESDLLPVWKGKLITSITKKDDVLPLLDTIVARSPSMAKRVDACLRRFFTWCVGRDILTKHPLEGIDPVAKVSSRERTLKDAELAKIWKAASVTPYHAAVRMLLLTGARLNEICALRWTEVNGDKIELAGSRTKMGKPHTIPLSAQALKIIKNMPKDGELVFGKMGSQSRKKDELDASSGVSDWRLHDLRRTVSTQMNELGMAEPWIVEAVLGHAVTGSAAPYNRARHEAAKRAALEAWGAYVSKLVR